MRKSKASPRAQAALHEVGLHDLATVTRCAADIASEIIAPPQGLPRAGDPAARFARLPPPLPGPGLGPGEAGTRSVLATQLQLRRSLFTKKMEQPRR